MTKPETRSFQQIIEPSPVFQTELSRTIVDIIQQAGPIMVIDPEKAVNDLDDTLERTKIAAAMGMKIILIGGSTDNGEADIVVPAVRNAIDAVAGKTLLLAFPGSSRQIAQGVHVALLLELPQIYKVFNQNRALETFLRGERDKIIQKCQKYGIPLVPVTYLLFSAGGPTSVEKVTGISGINVRGGVNVSQIMDVVAPWCNLGDLVFLELGSAPCQSISLAPIAYEVYEITRTLPIISGGINKPEHVQQITSVLPCPVGFGSLAENTPPERFDATYQGLLSAHPLYTNKQLKHPPDPRVFDF